MADQETIDLITQQNEALEKQAELRAKIDKIQDSSLSDLDVELRKTKEISSELVRQITLIQTDAEIRKTITADQLESLEKETEGCQ